MNTQSEGLHKLTCALMANDGLTMPKRRKIKRLKSDYLRNCATLVETIKATTHEKYNSLDHRMLLSSLRDQTVESYNRLVEAIKTY